MKYAEIKKEYVIETIGKGTEVIACDFQSKRMSNCNDLTVGNILNLIEKEETIFYKAVANE